MLFTKAKKKDLTEALALADAKIEELAQQIAGLQEKDARAKDMYERDLGIYEEQQARLRASEKLLADCRCAIEKEEMYERISGNISHVSEELRARYAQLQEADQVLRQSLVSCPQCVEESSELPSLESKMEALTSARSRIRGEQGKALYDQYSEKLEATSRELDRLREECQRAAAESAVLRRKAMHELAPWEPQKKLLMAEHKIGSDEITRALEAQIDIYKLMGANRQKFISPPYSGQIDHLFSLSEDERCWLHNGDVSFLEDKIHECRGVLDMYRTGLALS